MDAKEGQAGQGGVSTWSTTTSKVVDIVESHGQKYYKLDPKPELWKHDLQRSEILKVPSN